MPQSDGMGGRLQRMALRVKGSGRDYWYYFKVNPEEYTETYPQRSTVFRTRSGNVVEDFGPDVPTVEFSGTTGFKQDSRGYNGARRMLELSEILDDYADSGYNTEERDLINKELHLYNYTDDKSWRVSLVNDGYSIERSAERPLLFNYKLGFYLLSDLETPKQGQVANPTIGNDATNATGSGGTATNSINPNGIKPYSQVISEGLITDISKLRGNHTVGK